MHDVDLFMFNVHNFSDFCDWLSKYSLVIMFAGLFIILIWKGIRHERNDS